MKKLALLLGALSLVSSVAYAKEVVPAVEEVVVVEEVKAAPMLRVTNVGQYIEIDNTSGGEDIGEEVHFANVVGLAYGDWTFGLMARKSWSMDTDDGIHSANHRMELDFWRNYENFSVGAIWRAESDFDRYLARVKYSYGMFSGDLLAGYKFMNNDENDYFYAEGMPLAFTYGPVKIGYYFEYSKYNGTGSDKDNDMETEYLQQVRISAPVYTGDKLSLALEYRYQFDHEQDYEQEKAWDENNRHIGLVYVNYDVNEALSIYSSYEYDFHKYSDRGLKHEAKEDNYYGEFVLGWNYAF